MRESAVEHNICNHAKRSGWLVYKFSSPNHRGVPDRLFISPTGKVCFMEVKAPGKRPTPLQEREINKLRDRGVAATWYDNSPQACDWLDSHI